MKSICLFIVLTSYAFAAYPQLFKKWPILELEEVKLVVTYTQSYQQDSLNPEDIREETMVLLLGNSISNFFSYNKFLFDQGVREITNITQLQEWINLPGNLSGTMFQYYIYKNYPLGKITTTDYRLDPYKYQEDLQLFNWNIGVDTFVYKGHQVQKATTTFGGRDWIAWFAAEIPYNDGPYRFNGLPGLILKVHDTRNHYAFELVSIEKPQEAQMIEFLDRNYINTTKKNFFRVQEAFRHDIITRAQQAGLDNHSQQVAAQNMKRMNNPIELIVE